METKDLAKHIRNLLAVVRSSEVKSIKGDAFCYASLSLYHLINFCEQVEKEEKLAQEKTEAKKE